MATFGPRRTRDRRLAIRSAIATAAALALAGQMGCTSESESQSEPAPARPDVIVYLVDTLRADHLSTYGYPRETSPHLSDFARDAVLYETVYSPSSWTKPAVASLLTGLRPARHGAVTRASPLAGDVTLLPELFQPLGYRTAAFVTNPNVLPVWGFGRGFDHFVDLDSELRHATAADVGAALLDDLDRQTGNLGRPAGPLLYYVHTRDPHKPYEPPPGFGDTWRPPDPTANPRADAVARYDGEIRYGDHHFGRLLDALEARGRYRDSWIVFTSDHGDEFWEHDGVGHGRTLFDEVVRVPLLVKWPDNAYGGTRVSAPVSLVDVLPTLAAGVGIELPDDLDGAVLPTSGGDSGRAVFMNVNVTRNGQQVVMDAVSRDGHKYVRTSAPRRREELFDLAADPAESQNLAAMDKRLASQLEELLDGREVAGVPGYHVWIVGRPEPGTVRAIGALQTTGAFRETDVRPGVELTLDEDGHTLRFEVEIATRDNPIGQQPARLVGLEEIVFQLEPADAGLSVVDFRLDGDPGDVFVGQDMRRAPGPPYAVPRLTLSVESAATFFGVDAQVSVTDPPGLYLGEVHVVRPVAIEIAPDLDERLEALGYIE